MSAIFEEVTICWGTDDEGNPVEYKVQPTYRMVQAIEQKVSIAGLSDRVMRGDPPMSHIADVIAHMLRSAGAKVDSEEVYAEMMNSDDADAITDLAMVVITAFVPQKKSSGSRKSKPAKGGKKRTK